MPLLVVCASWITRRNGSAWQPSGATGIAQGAQLETPNATLNAFYDTHLMHMLVINDREPGADRNVARCGGFHYGSFPDEGIMVTSDLDRRGYTEDAARCLELYVKYQGTAPLPGNYQTSEGVFYGSGGYEVAGYNRNQGWVLWGLAEHTATRVIGPGWSASRRR